MGDAESMPVVIPREVTILNAIGDLVEHNHVAQLPRKLRRKHRPMPGKYIALGAYLMLDRPDFVKPLLEALDGTGFDIVRKMAQEIGDTAPQWMAEALEQLGRENPD